MSLDALTVTSTPGEALALVMTRHSRIHTGPGEEAPGASALTGLPLLSSRWIQGLGKKRSFSREPRASVRRMLAQDSRQNLERPYPSQHGFQRFPECGRCLEGNGWLLSEGLVDDRSQLFRHSGI